MLYCSQASLDMAYGAEVTLDHHLPFPLLSFLGMQLLDLDFVLENGRDAKKKEETNSHLARRAEERFACGVMRLTSDLLL